MLIDILITIALFIIFIIACYSSYVYGFNDCVKILMESKNKYSLSEKQMNDLLDSLYNLKKDVP